MLLKTHNLAKTDYDIWGDKRLNLGDSRPLRGSLEGLATRDEASKVTDFRLSTVDLRRFAA